MASRRNTPREWALAIGGGLVFAAGLVWVLRGGEPETAGIVPAPPAAAVMPPPAVQPPPAAGSTAPADLTLSGLRAGPDGGMAIVVSGGRQYLLRPGRSLPGGVRLVRVEATRAILASASGEIILTFTESKSAAASAAPPGGDPTPWLLALSPVREGGALTGWRLGDVQALPALARAGLQPGDVLIAVDDNELISQEKIMELPQELAANGMLQLTYRRGSQQKQVTITP